MAGRRNLEPGRRILEPGRRILEPLLFFEFLRDCVEFLRRLTGRRNSEVGITRPA